MQTLYDRDAPKRATNLSINSDLLKRARSMNVNLSATLEKALEAKLAESEAEQWQRENSNAIKAYNDAISDVRHCAYSSPLGVLLRRMLEWCAALKRRIAYDQTLELASS